MKCCFTTDLMHSMKYALRAHFCAGVNTRIFQEPKGVMNHSKAADDRRNGGRNEPKRKSGF